MPTARIVPSPDDADKPENWEVLPGTARRYRNRVTGEVISRSAYDKRVGRLRGTTFRTPAQQAAARRATGVPRNIRSRKRAGHWREAHFATLDALALYASTMLGGRTPVMIIALGLPYANDQYEVYDEREVEGEDGEEETLRLSYVTIMPPTFNDEWTVAGVEARMTERLDPYAGIDEWVLVWRTRF